jgi:hypothetical protein
VAFDRVMNPVLRDCVELYTHEGRHAPGPFLFLSTAIVSMTIESLPSSSPMFVVCMFTAGPSTPSGGFVGAPPMALSSFPISSSPFSPQTGLLTPAPHSTPLPTPELSLYPIPITPPLLPPSLPKYTIFGVLPGPTILKN